MEKSYERFRASQEEARWEDLKRDEAIESHLKQIANALISLSMEDYAMQSFRADSTESKVASVPGKIAEKEFWVQTVIDLPVFINSAEEYLDEEVVQYLLSEDLEELIIHGDFTYNVPTTKAFSKGAGELSLEELILEGTMLRNQLKVVAVTGTSKIIYEVSPAEVVKATDNLFTLFE